VTPRISPDEVIVMEVAAEKSAFIPGQGVPVFTDVNTGGVIRSPVKDIITAQTTVSIPNGQTIVLGGMITTLDDVIERKVPGLGDLPLIGRAFRHDISTTRRTELLIFLTPRIVHNSLESEMMKQIEACRISFCEGCAEQIHGPLFAVPEDDAMVFPEQLPLPSPAPLIDE
jgi:type II secretory pathway component GspD/PulD (secretin)